MHCSSQDVNAHHQREMQPHNCRTVSAFIVLCIKHSEMNGICGSEIYDRRVNTELLNFKWTLQCVMRFFGHFYADNGPDLQQYSILTPTGILELIRGKNNFIKNHISDLGLYV